MATVWDWATNRSINLNHHAMFPNVAIVDPELAISMPESVNDLVSSHATSANKTICMFIPKNEQVEEINSLR